MKTPEPTKRQSPNPEPETVALRARRALRALTVEGIAQPAGGGRSAQEAAYVQMLSAGEQQILAQRAQSQMTMTRRQIEQMTGGGSSFLEKLKRRAQKPDPYAEHFEKLYGKTGIKSGRYHEYFAWMSAQDAKHEAKLSKLAQATERIDRKVPPRHPSDFEVDDSPTNVWCNGKP